VTIPNVFLWILGIVFNTVYIVHCTRRLTKNDTFVTVTENRRVSLNWLSPGWTTWFRSPYAALRIYFITAAIRQSLSRGTDRIYLDSSLISPVPEPQFWENTLEYINTACFPRLSCSAYALALYLGDTRFSFLPVCFYPAASFSRLAPPSPSEFPGSAFS
jgi:hypothetical protein